MTENDGNASLAAETALFMSAAPPAEIIATGCPVAGLMTSRATGTEEPTHFLPIKNCFERALEKKEDMDGT